MSVVKSAAKRVLAAASFESHRLSPAERLDLPGDVQMNFREAVSYRAIGGLGELSIAEARLLAELVRASDPSRPIVEIGTLFGHSTLVMTLAKAQEQQIISVDNYSWNPLGLSPEVHFRTTSNRLRDAIATENVTLLRVSSDEFYRTYDGPPPALFFCDADHAYEPTKTDLLWARSVDATVVCGDDYEPRFDGVVRAVDELGGPRQLVGGLFVL
jgi:predicted O-methyltransferase YrrM